MASFENGSIDLAREEDFRFGDLSVTPSQGRATANGLDARVEPRVMEVLILLRRSMGETVTKDELIDACWSGRAVSDDAVTRAIAKARKLGRLGGGAHFTIETVPKVGFRLTTPVVDGVVIASNALRAHGAKASPPVAKASSRVNSNSVLILVAAVAIAAVGALSLAISSKSAGLIEIEDFMAASEDAGVAYIVGKIGDATAQHLPGVSVLAKDRPSSWPPSYRTPALRLAGQVERIDDRIIVSARILERASGTTLWSGEFERPAATYRGLEEGAALTIASALQCALTEQKAARRSFDAHALSLWLRACGGGGAVDRLEPARTLATAEPQRAESHAMFALVAAEAGKWGNLAPEQAASLLQTAADSAATALKLDPQSVRANTALSLLATTLVERGAHLKRALDAHPDRPATLVHYIVFLRAVGRLDDARNAGTRTLRMADPRLFGNLPHVAFLSAMAGDAASAEKAIRKYETVYPGEGGGLRWTNAVWWEDASITASRMRQMGLDERYADRLDCFEYLLPLIARGEQRLDPPAACNGLAPEWRARLLARVGDVDGAYAILFELEKTHLLTQILFYPEMKAVRHDPRFMPLAERLGLLAYWRETNQWPDFCREPDLPYECPATGAQLRTSGLP